MTANPRQSFKLKLCLSIFAVATVTFLLVIFACIYFVRQEVRNDLDALVDAKLNYALRTLDEGLSTTQVSAENLESISKSPLVKHRRDSIYSLCEHFLRSNPRIQGVAIGYEPGVVKGHEAGFSPYVMRDGDSFIRRDLAETKDYRSSNWYKVARDTGKPYWSKPFRESNGTVITSYNVPLRNERDEVYAVMAVDLNLDVMNDSLQKLKPYPSAMLTVLDEDGTFVAHPNRDYIITESLQSLTEKAPFAPNPRVLADIRAHRRGADEYRTQDETYYIYYAPVEKNGWTVTLEVAKSEVARGYYKMFNAIVIAMIIGIILLICITLAAINRITRPLESFAQAARQISHGDFRVNLPVIKDHNELYDLRQALVSMGMSIDMYVNELEASTASKAAMESELNVARNIQMAMLPKTFPPFPERDEIDVFASLTPAKAVGGDLYDYLLDGDNLFFCIGDVSGKGVPASLVMAITRALFRISATHLNSPADIAATINNAIAENNSENMFVTMFIAKCNLKTGEFTCCNCGHNPPATNGIRLDTSTFSIAPSDKADFMKLAPVNIPIGVIENFEYKEVTMHITPGVSIFLYTDGVTEAENSKKEFYGEKRLLERLCEVGKNGSAKDIIEHVISDVNRHAHGMEQSDDITVLCFKYKTRQMTYRLTINNSVEEMAQLGPFMKQVCEAFGVAPDMRFQLSLAIDEALSNAVNYAYGEGKGEIVLEAAKDRNHIVFSLLDGGAPFDPTSKGEDVDTTSSAEDRPVGGLGIFLIKQMMDEVSYQRKEDRNILIMKKKIQIL